MSLRRRSRFVEPRKLVFWDNCVWVNLFGIGGQANSDSEKKKREYMMKNVLPVLENGLVGVVFSPCLLFEAPKDTDYIAFEQEVKRFEAAGYATILHEIANYNELYELRKLIRGDITAHPHIYAGIAQPAIAVGDCTVVHAAIMTGCDELWTYDPFLLRTSGRPCVRGLRVCEPYSEGQFSLQFE